MLKCFPVNYDYRPLKRNITFGATESVRSQQCLQIETVDDSLAEQTESFTVSVFTNNSAVNQEIHTIPVECRVTPAGDLTASVTSEQLRREGSAIDNRLQDSKETNVVVSTANGSRATCTETADSLKS